MIKKPEILSPAGDFEKLKAAIRFGADAVYVGGKSFGMRAASGNFTVDELPLAIQLLEVGMLVMLDSFAVGGVAGDELHITFLVILAAAVGAENDETLPGGRIRPFLACLLVEFLLHLRSGGRLEERNLLYRVCAVARTHESFGGLSLGNSVVDRCTALAVGQSTATGTNFCLFHFTSPCRDNHKDAPF